MAWCRQATSHYLSQCWPRSLSPYGVTRPQWVKQYYQLYMAFGTVSRSLYNVNKTQSSRYLSQIMVNIWQLWYLSKCIEMAGHEQQHEVRTQKKEVWALLDYYDIYHSQQHEVRTQKKDVWAILDYDDIYHYQQHEVRTQKKEVWATLDYYDIYHSQQHEVRTQKKDVWAILDYDDIYHSQQHEVRTQKKRNGQY